MPMDKNRYPADWKKIARAVKEAAGWKCQACGKQCRRPGEPLHGPERAGHVYTLTVHHKDHVPEHCDADNLIALCAPCHLKADAKHHAESRKRHAAKKQRAGEG